MQILTGRKIEVTCVAFSPNNRHLAAGGRGGLEVWDLNRPADKPLFFNFA
ncbi:MAG TPA: WD40 repeat domain-containing protein [Gemmataceae bacterium]|nr:WD40 repeat domain-containing protein [Gemmataceae bacterium]